ncbi:MAG TPA: hypothetical protein VGR47_05185 [Terracidiphilus sp.]|nr:hypothetical protein [Terracidiphilus sp.]
MKNAVLRDFSNLSISATRVHEGKLPSGKFWLGVEMPAFDYWERSRELFYTNTRLQLLRMQCEIIKRLKALVENKQQSPDEAMAELWSTIVLVVICHDTLQWKRMARNIRRERARPSVDKGTAGDSGTEKSSFFTSPGFMNRFVAKFDEFFRR